MTLGAVSEVTSRLLSELIIRNGPVPFSVAMDVALYGPGGFYAAGGGAGRRRDFITSPEVGALFGAVLANALDARWQALGCPDPFMVAEVGAGPGMLARSVLAAVPRCSEALRYIMVDRSEAMRALHSAHLSLTSADELLGRSATAGLDSEEDARIIPGQGPLVASMAALPAQRFRGVIVANELLDNLAFDLLERQADGWVEVRITNAADGTAQELLVPAAPDLSDWAEAIAPDAPFGGRIPRQRQAWEWVQSARLSLEAGTVMVVDYCVESTAALSERDPAEWLRTYRAHGRGRHPFEDIGSQDITVDVAIDQLPRCTRMSSQADALGRWGISTLVAEARATWHERASIGDLAALQARSRVQEAEALTDLTGLGSFTVMEWDVGRIASVQP